jgi:fermentation-respiration switch protein FrsA (DUF1100 family)
VWIGCLAVTLAAWVAGGCTEGEGLADAGDASDDGQAEDGAEPAPADGDGQTAETDGDGDGLDGAEPDPYEQWLRSFDYDAGAPLDLQVLSTHVQAGVEVRDVSYAGARGQVPAYLIVPPGVGPFAGVVFLHWGMGDRSEFLEEALGLAQRGAYGLLLDAPWLRPDNPPSTPDQAGVQIIVDVRRGVDLLLTLQGLAPDRLAFVGHSFGASRGGVLAGVERRFLGLVLMAGYARPSVYDGASAPGEFMDGLYYVGHAAPARLLFQFGRQDEYVSEAMALEFFDPASEPKSIAWCECGHALDDEARAARTAWLAELLTLSIP